MNIFTDEEKVALDKIIEKLSDVEKSNDDLFDVVAVLVSDLKDMYNAFDEGDAATIEREKKDAINTALSLISKLNNF